METCACGHEFDEHENGAECGVEGCGCVHYEEGDGREKHTLIIRWKDGVEGNSDSPWMLTVVRGGVGHDYGFNDERNARECAGSYIKDQNVEAVLVCENVPPPILAGDPFEGCDGETAREVAGLLSSPSLSREALVTAFEKAYIEHADVEEAKDAFRRWLATGETE